MFAVMDLDSIARRVAVPNSEPASLPAAIFCNSLEADVLRSCAMCHNQS
jgi:cytochrome c peroxidase